MRRVAVVGTSGSGKTTMARALAARLGVPHVELDALHHLADWRPCPPEQFRAAVAERMADDGWVVDGNYTSKLGHLVLDAADAVVWLDLPRRTVVRRVAVRTITRALRRQELWNGNRESWSNLRSLRPERNMILWAWTTHARNRHRYVEVLDERWVRLRSTAEARRWLAAVSPAGGSA